MKSNFFPSSLLTTLKLRNLLSTHVYLAYKRCTCMWNIPSCNLRKGKRNKENLDISRNSCLAQKDND